LFQKAKSLMATPRNHLEIVLIDRGFSTVNEKHFKKIYIPIYSTNNNSENSCCIDVDVVDAFEFERKKLYDSFPSDVADCGTQKQSYFSRLRKLYHCFDSSQSSSSAGKTSETLYLYVNSLPQSIRETVFDDQKFNVENWSSLNEAIVWLAWLKTLEVPFERRESQQMAEYINILNTIRSACLSREMILDALYLK